jgi:hypothetical protein
MTTPETDITATIDQEETRLVKQRDGALVQARHKPTQVNVRALRIAERELDTFRSDRYESASEQTFGSLMDVVAYLDAEWRIRKSTIYEHKDAGKIRPGGEGKYTMATVMEYARQHLQRKDGRAGEEKANLQEQKLLEEIRRISSDANMRDLNYRERQGELIPREHVEVELAARASDLKTHLDASARSSSTRIIKLVGGDVQKAPELISFMLGINRKVLDNYSRPIAGPDEEEE